MTSAQSVAPTLFSGVSGVLGCGISQHKLPTNSHYFGRQLVDAFPATFHQLDLVHQHSAASLIAELRPQLFVHAACISSAQQCADNVTLTSRVNIESVREISRACAQIDCHLVYISTEQVFAGDVESYTEKCKPNSTTTYGASKAAAEEIVLQDGATVVRLPLLLGPNYSRSGGGADFALLQALAAGSEPSLFEDEWRSPVAADEIWPMIKLLGARKIGGVFHLAGADVVSRYELAQMVCRVANVAPDFRHSSIADFKGPRRSPRLALSCERAQLLLDYRPPSLETSLLRLHSSSRLPNND
jgi:dTDP-4-dehydrorhamnose reductase